MKAWLARLGGGLRALWHRSRTEQELDEELRAFLDEAVARKMRAGMDSAAAARAARLELGGPQSVKDHTRDAGWESAADAVWQDLRFGVRMLRRAPRFAAVAILTLALGVGATTVVFSLVHTVLIDPFPYTDADRSVVFTMRGVTNVGGWRGRTAFFEDEIRAFREENQVFEDVIASRIVTALHDDGRSTRSFQAAHVTSNTIDYFGVPPLMGHGFTAEDGRTGAAPVFAMNYRLWQREFGADPDILGRTLRLNGQPFTLVAIMPRAFNAFAADIWIPNDGDAGGRALMGRLKPGISLETATADLDGIAHRYAEAHPGGNNPVDFVIHVQPWLYSLLGDFRGTLYGLLGAVLLLLLIACANVANLLLARATVREAEIAMRASIGATRGRLVRQLLMESLVLASAASIAGTALAVAGVAVVDALMPAGTVPPETVIRISLPALLAALALTACTTLACGLAPALHLVTGELNPRLAGGARGSARTHRHGRLRSGLVVAEVALSIVLLTGAGFLIRDFLVLTRVDLGFNPDRVLYVRPFFPRDYDADRQNAFTRELLARMQALPGVSRAAESMLVPPLTHDWSDTIIPGKPHVERWETRFELCSEGYFATIGLRLLQGTLFTESDVAAKRLVVVVNQTFARQYLPGENPLGTRVKFQVLDRPFLDAPKDAYFEIVGVVSDHKTWGGAWQTVPQAFLPYSVQGFSYRTFLARTLVEPDALLPAIRETVWSIDPNIGIRASGTIDGSLRDFYRDPQFDLVVLGGFAAIGLVLVAVGIFSVMAYAVVRRTHEIGVRIALGAERAQVIRLVLASGLRLMVIGCAMGLLGAYAFSRSLVSQTAAGQTDAATAVVVSLIVLATGLLACFVPAHRATRVDPLTALREE